MVTTSTRASWVPFGTDYWIVIIKLNFKFESSSQY
jgi:hypothetical protein